MSFLIKKLSKICIDEYMANITDKHRHLVSINETVKIADDDIKIPTLKSYDILTKYNYKLTQLRAFARHYKLKLDGNKKELVTRIFLYLYLSNYIIKIQKITRGRFHRMYHKLHGPAYKNRSLCTNDSDFITMDSLGDIDFHQFMSYTDADNFIYGFDISSLYNLFMKCDCDPDKFKNPYTRRCFPLSVYKNISRAIQLSKLFKIRINLEIEDDTLNVTSLKAIELRTLSLFQNIDALGNYTDPQWFLSLNRNQIIKMMRELMDIFTYRAQLENTVKQNICPPHGNPFIDINMNYIHNEVDLNNIRRNVLCVLEKFVNSGINNDSKSLGAYYVLASLTLVNDIAANSLPWLYQSVTYI